MLSYLLGLIFTLLILRNSYIGNISLFYEIEQKLLQVPSTIYYSYSFHL